jgi:hypothetical protein
VYYTQSAAPPGGYPPPPPPSGGVIDSGDGGTGADTTGAPAPAAVYAFAMEWPDGNALVLTQPALVPGRGPARARMLGSDARMAVEARAGAEGGLVVTIPPLNPKQLPSSTGPWVFELTNVQ